MKLINNILDFLFPDNLRRKIELLENAGFKLDDCVRYKLGTDFIAYDAVLESSYNNIYDFIYEVRGAI